MITSDTLCVKSKALYRNHDSRSDIVPWARLGITTTGIVMFTGRFLGLDESLTDKKQIVVIRHKSRMEFFTTDSCRSEFFLYRLAVLNLAFDAYDGSQAVR